MRNLKPALLVGMIGVAGVLGSVAHGGALPNVGPNGGGYFVILASTTLNCS